jgi:hypothetical protein
MPLFFGPGNNSFARCIKNCSINKNQNQEFSDPAQYISTTGNPTITYPGNDYIVYTFTEPYGEFFSSIDLSVNVVIVGGGGGGGGGLVFSGGLSGGIGGSGGGGGGAGEVINLNNVLITNNNNNVINVGNGGAYGNGGSGTEIYASNGYNGEKSYFNNISANGGYGGNYSTISESGLGGLSGSESSIIPGGGGFGGYENNYGRNGYNGSQVNIGPNLIYYGGGGCGGQNNNNPFLNGGLGGGSSTNVNLGNGVVNTGGGGGGGDYYFSRNTGEHGGNGGSGLVIIYFQYNQPSTTSYEIACPPYKCPETINKKSLNSNADVDQTLTLSSRAVNAIRYAPGGKTQYGYSATIYQNSQVTYLGRVEGQPGGIGRLSGRNRF